MVHTLRGSTSPTHMVSTLIASKLTLISPIYRNSAILKEMPFSSVQSKKLASSRKRDEKGHFIKETAIKTKLSISTPTTDLNPEFEKPLVSVSITNPFKKILYWLDQIRKKQTTTFAMKLSIPLIALPVIIFTAFQLGRGSIFIPFLSPPSAQSPAPSPTPIISPFPITVYSRTGTLKIARSGTKITYLLTLKNGENIILEVPANINLSTYQNKQVLVTGTYSRQTNILKVQDIAEVEVFNTTVISSPTPSPIQSTPSAQPSP